MRKLLFLGSLSLGLAFNAFAHQRAATPSFTAAPAAPHAAPAPTPTHTVAPAHPAHTSNTPNTTSAIRQKPIPRPSPIIVPPVSSITTTAANPCGKRFGSSLGGYNACPSPIGGAAIYGGAYYIPVPYYYTDAGAEELPPGPQDVDQLAANDQVTPRPDDSEEEPPAARPSGMGSGEINKALAEFVFVNRDGTKFTAVAYSFVNDKLQYVTKEGVRHTQSLDSLDLDATQKLNEQLGNTINLPNLVPASGVAANAPAPSFPFRLSAPVPASRIRT
jgi:hypothetical protein